MPKSRKPKKPTRGDVKASPPTTVSVSYQRCDAGKDYCLSHCDQDQVRQAVDALRTACSLDWLTLHRHRGLNTEKISDDALKVGRPDFLDDDVPIYSLRASRRFRILWYRTGDVMHLLWFDPLHKIYEG
jgi:hypothetical protein